VHALPRRNREGRQADGNRAVGRGVVERALAAMRDASICGSDRRRRTRSPACSSISRDLEAAGQW
jgi:hypothetical protein